MPMPDCDAGEPLPGHGDEAIDEIGRRLRDRQRAPAQLVGRSAGFKSLWISGENGVNSPCIARRADAAQPAGGGSVAAAVNVRCR